MSICGLARQTAEVFTPEDFSDQHQMIGQTKEEFAVNAA
jgi:hypothetical protein